MTELERYRREQMQDPEFKTYSMEMQSAAELSKTIVGLRLEKEMTQAELAKHAGLTQSYISNIEACEENPSLKTLERIARALDIQLKITLVPIEKETLDETC